MKELNTSSLSEDSEELHTLGTTALVSAGAMFIAKAIRIFFLSLVNVILINLLKPEDFGSVKYVLIIVGIAILINEMGLSTAIVQKKEFSQNLLFPLFLITSLWGFFLYGIVFILAPFLSIFFNAPELTNIFRVGTLIIPILSVSSVHRAYLRRKMEFVKLAIIETIATLLSSILSVTIALLGGGSWALLGGYLLFEAINTLLLLFIQKIPILTLSNLKDILPLLFWGVGVVIFNIIDYMLSNASYFLIGKLVGREALGFFSVSQDLAFLPRVGITAVSGVVILSTFSRIQDDIKKTCTAFRKLVLLISIISIPFQLMMIIMPEELLRIICFVKENSIWLNAAPLLKWISATAIIYNYTYFLNTI
ncbi:MAG: oligosaccharide flippase family protein, partial [Chitinispirillaceae bacterium]|nr:oligosaccharide flippase family protein [Chitinispirillaceae bacterium]